MTPKAVFLSALIAVALLAVALHHANSSRGRHIENTVETPGPAPSRVTDSGPMDSQANALATTRTPPQTIAAKPSRPEIQNRLGIPSDLLDDARKQAEERAAGMAGYQSGMNDARYLNQSLNSGNPSRKLALRLGLDEATAQRVDAVLTAARSEQIKQLLGAEQDRMNRESRMLAEDRESYVNYLALQTMQSRGSPLTETQKTFCESFRQKLEPADTAATAVVSINWYEDPKLIEAMNQKLSPAKRPELADYVAEQKLRDQELKNTQIQMRAHQIAGQLGLSRAEQATLADYLKESPDATAEELSALLTPELRKLLIPGGH